MGNMTSFRAFAFYAALVSYGPAAVKRVMLSSVVTWGHLYEVVYIIVQSVVVIVMYMHTVSGECTRYGAVLIFPMRRLSYFNYSVGSTVAVNRARSTYRQADPNTVEDSASFFQHFRG